MFYDLTRNAQPGFEDKICAGLFFECRNTYIYTRKSWENGFEVSMLKYDGNEMTTIPIGILKGLVIKYVKTKWLLVIDLTTIQTNSDGYSVAFKALINLTYHSDQNTYIYRNEYVLKVENYYFEDRNDVLVPRFGEFTIFPKKNMILFYCVNWDINICQPKFITEVIKEEEEGNCYKLVSNDGTIFRNCKSRSMVYPSPNIISVNKKDETVIDLQLGGHQAFYFVSKFEAYQERFFSKSQSKGFVQNLFSQNPKCFLKKINNIHCICFKFEFAHISYLNNGNKKGKLIEAIEKINLQILLV